MLSTWRESVRARNGDGFELGRVSQSEKSRYNPVIIGEERACYGRSINVLMQTQTRE